jgi:hypothetical protein
MSANPIGPYHSADHEIIIFGARTCSVCGETFAANTDYFPPDKRTGDGLRTDCRNCIRERSRKRDQRPEVRERRLALARARYRRTKAAS